jgi:hypothetical protein
MSSSVIQSGKSSRLLTVVDEPGLLWASQKILPSPWMAHEPGWAHTQMRKLWKISENVGVEASTNLSNGLSSYGGSFHNGHLVRLNPPSLFLSELLTS